MNVQGTPLTSTADAVDAVLAFMAQPGCSDAEFDALAVRLFARQYACNEAYRRVCQRRGHTPRQVKGWRDIPATPIDAFKDLALVCEPPAEHGRVFMTSGTTRGDRKGRHHHPTLDVYDASMVRNFSARFLQGVERLRMGILFPDETTMPNSSLAHYLALAVRHGGTPGSRGFVGPDGLAVEPLVAFLREAERAGEPCALLGATYSFVHLMDALGAAAFRLPPGSRLLDTGGTKRQSRDMPADAFYDALAATFGVARADCFNMYGMTELSTQFYDAGNGVVPSVKSGPHWIRSRVVDPLSGREVPRGERGLLVHCDLANIHSVTTILTEDIGIAVEGGFLLLGRAEGAEAKGCSLAVEEFLRAAG